MNVTSAISKTSSTDISMDASGSATKTVVIIVAHPDDETLWAGGTIMVNSSWKCYVVCLCCKDDMEQASRFYKALKILKVQGIMGDIKDGPEQKPLNVDDLERKIISLLPPWHFDLIITHNPNGEYTSYIRYKETAKAVINLWYKRKLSSSELWTFAYEDGNKAYHPRPIIQASVHQNFSVLTWLRKYIIITKTYGFKTNSFEAKTTPSSEAFWQYKRPEDAYGLINQFKKL